MLQWFVQRENIPQMDSCRACHVHDIPIKISQDRLHVKPVLKASIQQVKGQHRLSNVSLQVRYSPVSNQTKKEYQQERL